MTYQREQLAFDNHNYSVPTTSKLDYYPLTLPFDKTSSISNSARLELYPS